MNAKAAEIDEYRAYGDCVCMCVYMYMRKFVYGDCVCVCV